MFLQGGVVESVLSTDGDIFILHVFYRYTLTEGLVFKKFRKSVDLEFFKYIADCIAIMGRYRDYSVGNADSWISSYLRNTVVLLDTT